MKSSAWLPALGLAIGAASFADAAIITGTVTGPDGAPFRGAFVQARNAATKITVSVLSDNAGRYRAENLGPGDYRVSIRAPGFKADPKSGLALAADASATQDFKLQQDMVRWSDISFYQGLRLLPDHKGKDLYFRYCFACHGFESRMAKIKRDEDGWRSRVSYMKDAMGYFIMRPQNEFNDQKAEDIVQYLTYTFGDDSTLPKSPAEINGYNETVRKFSDDALKIVYVEYETPGPDRMPWSAHPAKDGSFWVPYYGRANKIARQSRNRRDAGIPGAECRHGCYSFRGAGARRFGLAHRAGLEQARQVGPDDPEDYRISGRLGEAHHPRRPRRNGLVDRRTKPLRSEDRKIHSYP
jgi:hypothetical protein